MDLTSVQLAYDGALRRLLADLTGAIEAPPIVAVDFTDPEDLPYLFTDSLSVHRTWLPWADDEEEATVQLADRLQDDVLDELWGQAWPACRGHEHPARPCAIDGKAVWVCPTTGDILWAIGSVRP